MFCLTIGSRRFISAISPATTTTSSATSITATCTKSWSTASPWLNLLIIIVLLLLIVIFIVVILSLFILITSILFILLIIRSFITFIVLRVCTITHRMRILKLASDLLNLRQVVIDIQIQCCLSDKGLFIFKILMLELIFNHHIRLLSLENWRNVESFLQQLILLVRITIQNPGLKLIWTVAIGSRLRFLMLIFILLLHSVGLLFWLDGPVCSTYLRSFSSTSKVGVFCLWLFNIRVLDLSSRVILDNIIFINLIDCVDRIWIHNFCIFILYNWILSIILSHDVYLNVAILNLLALNQYLVLRCWGLKQRLHRYRLANSLGLLCFLILFLLLKLSVCFELWFILSLPSILISAISNVVRDPTQTFFISFVRLNGLLSLIFLLQWSQWLSRCLVRYLFSVGLLLLTVSWGDWLHAKNFSTLLSILLVKLHDQYLRLPNSLRVEAFRWLNTISSILILR